jgi:ABC-type sugar transport system permease subunit
MTYPLTTLVAEEVTNTGPEFGEASPIGLLIVVLLLIGVFILVRSMNRHLKRVPQSFDAPDDADSREPPRESGG